MVCQSYHNELVNITDEKNLICYLIHVVITFVIRSI